MEKDLSVAKVLYEKIRDNKELIISFIDDILDLATFIPVCIKEYQDSSFDLYNPSTLIIEDLLAILHNYGFNIITTY